MDPLPAEVDLLEQLRSGSANLKVILYRNAINIAAETVLDNIQEANFDGYVPWAPAGFSPPVRGREGQFESVTPLIKFEKAAGEVANTIYGYAVILMTSAGDRLLIVKPFPASRVLDTEGQKIEFFAKLLLSDFPV